MREVTNKELLEYIEHLCMRYNELSEKRGFCCAGGHVARKALDLLWRNDFPYVERRADSISDELALRAGMHTLSEIILEISGMMGIDYPASEILKGKKSQNDKDYEYEYSAYILPVIAE